MALLDLAHNLQPSLFQAAATWICPGSVGYQRDNRRLPNDYPLHWVHEPGFLSENADSFSGYWTLPRY